MKKTYYQQNLITQLTNRQVKTSFKKIGFEIFNTDFSDSTALLEKIKKFFYVVDVADPMLVITPNYLVKTKNTIKLVKKETHPFYNLFSISLSEIQNSDGYTYHDFEISINNQTLEKFLTDFVYFRSPTSLTDKITAYSILFMNAAKTFIDEKVVNNSIFDFKHYSINTHEQKNVNTLNSQNLYYDISEEYNFYVKEYEKVFSISGSNNETIIPNYYAIENYLNTDESDSIKSVVSLDGRIDVTEQNVLSSQYYVDYANEINSITSVEEKSSLSSVTNYVLDSFFGNTKNLSLSSENFPYASKFSFSNHPPDSLSTLITEKKLDTLVANNSHYVFNTEEKYQINDLYVVEQKNIKIPSENGDYVDYDGMKYELKAFNTSSVESIKYSNYKNVFNFINQTSLENQVTAGFEIYDLQGFAFYHPDNQKYLQLLKKPLAIFPYLIIKNEIENICKNVLDYNSVLNYRLLDVYTLCYQVEKKYNDFSVNNITISRNTNSSEVSFNDTQLIYEKEYNYLIYSLNFVNTFSYAYENVAYSVASNKISGLIKLTSNCSIFRNLVINDSSEIIDNPPTPVDVNIVPYINDSNRMLFMLNTQNTSLQDIPKIIFPRDINFFRRIRKKQKLNSKKVIFDTTEDLRAVQVFRTTKPPKKYTDFRDNLYGTIFLNSLTSASFIDRIKQNVKYYYTFRSIDIHNNFSNPTEVFEVEINNNDGAIFPIVSIYDMEKIEEFQYQKSMKKYLSISPSVLFTEFQKTEDGKINVGTLTDNSLWNQKFKIRVTSKKSGKCFDINLTLNKQTKNLINNTYDLNSDVVSDTEEEE